MPRPLPMIEIVRRCLRRVDLPDTGGPFTLPEVKSLVSEQYGQLYSHVVQSGMYYFYATETIIASGASSYPLPEDHDCTVGVDRTVDATGRTEQLDELMVQERDILAGEIGDARYYAMVGQSIVLFPRPSTGTYTHIYVPQSPDLSSLADASPVDLVTADGETLMIYGVAVKLSAKTELDPRMLIDERNAAEQRFVVDVGKRALVNPRRRIVRSTPFQDWEYDW